MSWMNFLNRITHMEDLKKEALNISILQATMFSKHKLFKQQLGFWRMIRRRNFLLKVLKTAVRKDVQDIYIQFLNCALFLSDVG